MKNVTVETNIGLDNMDISLVQSIEKSVDFAMAANGFHRTTTSKTGDKITLNYRQFAAAGVADQN